MANGTDFIAPSGQDFMRVGLMPNIPDNFIAWRLEYMMQRHGELDHSQSSTQMAAGNSDGINRLAAQIVGKLF